MQMTCIRLILPIVCGQCSGLYPKSCTKTRQATKQQLLFNRLQQKSDMNYWRPCVKV